jgi:hypothetical protein
VLLEAAPASKPHALAKQGIVQKYLNLLSEVGWIARFTQEPR